MICVLFDEVPPNTHFAAGSYSWVSSEDGIEYIVDGYGKEFDPQAMQVAGDEYLLPTNMPGRKELIAHGCEDIEDVREIDLLDVPGIGKKTKEKIQEYLAER